MLLTHLAEYAEKEQYDYQHRTTNDHTDGNASDDDTDNHCEATNGDFIKEPSNSFEHSYDPFI